MNYKHIVILLVISSMASCKKINPEKPTFSGDPISLPKAISSINLPLEIPLSYLEEHLNQGLKDLLFSQQGLSISDGLFTDINVIRTGKILLSSNGKNSLRVKIPMRIEGNLKIEKKIFGQMISTALPYDESIFPEISFIPEIGNNWDVSIKDVKIESWGKSLKYNLMGYEVDFDPIIRKQIEKIFQNQLSTNGLSRISFKGLMDKTWAAYGEPIKIEQGNIDAYLYTIPQKVKINESITSDQKLKLIIGLEGEVKTQVGERPNIKKGSLPGIMVNEDTVNHINITLPLAITYASLDHYLKEELVGKKFKMDPETNLIPEDISTQSFGDRALLKMKFTILRKSKKDLRGELFLVGKPTYDRNNEAIVFEDIDFDLNTKNILARSAGWLKQGQLLGEIKKHAVYPIGQYIDEARIELQQLGYINTDFASFQVQNPELIVDDIYVTENDIRIYLDATGKMEVKLKESSSLLD